MSGQSTAGASLPAAVPALPAAGICLVTMLVVSLAATFWPVVSPLAAPLLAWVAGAMLWSRVGRQQRWQTVAFMRTVATVPRLAPDPSIELTEGVSVICPARDEGDEIEAAMGTRLSDASPQLEFIAVDDRSDDDTGVP